MKAIHNIVRAGTALATVAAFAAPSVAQAQFARTIQLCQTNGTYCANVGLNLNSGILEVGVFNVGSTDGTTTSRITEIGLFSTVSGQTLMGTLLPTTGVAATTGQQFVGSPALAAGFATNGNGTDLQNGAGTTTTPVGVDFGNNGFLPIYADDAISGGFQRLSTDAGEYGLFRFNVAGSTVTLNNIGVGLRVQSIGAQGASDKCFSVNDADCRVGNPGTIGGGVTGAVVPEPSTYVLMGSGLLGLMGVAARRRKQQG